MKDGCIQSGSQLERVKLADEYKVPGQTENEEEDRIGWKETQAGHVTRASG